MTLNHATTMSLQCDPILKQALWTKR